MNRFLIILVLTGLLSACGAPVEPIDTEIVQTAIAQTLMAEWTATFTPKPTNTITPTWTPTATSTETPTPTFTNTPTMTASPSPTPDLRVIEIAPSDFLLLGSDLPMDAGYTIMEETYEWYFFDQVMYETFRYLFGVDAQFLGVENSAFLIDELIGGMSVTYERGTSKSIYPHVLVDTVASFRSVEGARLMIRDYSPCTHPNLEYTSIEIDLQIGDVTQYCTNTVFNYHGYEGSYNLAFTYRNFYHAIQAYEWESEAPLAFLEQVARSLFAKLEAAPLSGAITIQP